MMRIVTVPFMALTMMVFLNVSVSSSFMTTNAFTTSLSAPTTLTFANRGSMITIRQMGKKYISSESSNGTSSDDQEEKVNGQLLSSEGKNVNNKYGYTPKQQDSTTNDNKNKDNDETKEHQQQEEEAPMKTISGGPSLILAMAQRMLVWDDESYEANINNDSSRNLNQQQQFQQQQNELRQKGQEEQLDKFKQQAQSMIQKPSSFGMGGSGNSGNSGSGNRRTPTLPRWHPHDGIADANPAFRSQPPAMNNRGYAAIIRRNSRKRGKISLWRHALRMYDKMKTIELEQQQEELRNQTAASGTTAGTVPKKKKLIIKRSTEHFEAALVACAKLGLWREALGIYRELVEIEKKTSSISSTPATTSTTAAATTAAAAGGGVKNKNSIKVTDNMILSLISACVRGSRSRRQRDDFSLEERRAPLDAIREIVVNLEEKHDIPLVSTHVNPLAAAYQNLGLTTESSKLIKSCLADRLTIAPDEEAGTTTSFNINDVQAKDKASYNILIQDAIVEGNWTDAIESLQQMTEAGMYPGGRNLNGWYETAKKRETRSGGRKLRSWKKKRERMLVRSTLK